PTAELPISGGKDLPGFHQVLGYRQVSWTEDEAVIELDVQACHLNMAGVLHGGVLTSLLDVVLAEAGTYCPYPGRVRKAITLVLNTTFTGQCSGGRHPCHWQAACRRQSDFQQLRRSARPGRSSTGDRRSDFPSA